MRGGEVSITRDCLFFRFILSLLRALSLSSVEKVDIILILIVSLPMLRIGNVEFVIAYIKEEQMKDKLYIFCFIGEQFSNLRYCDGRTHLNKILFDFWFRY